MYVCEIEYIEIPFVFLCADVPLQTSKLRDFLKNRILNSYPFNSISKLNHSIKCLLILLFSLFLRNYILPNFLKQSVREKQRKC